MTLKAILSSLDGLSESVAANYTAQDGRFFLQVEPVDGHSLEDDAGLKSSLSKERANVKTLQGTLQDFEGLDAVAARDALGKMSEMATWTPEDKVREQIEAREKTITAKHAAEMEKSASDANGLRSQLEQQLIRNAAIEAITKLNGNVDLLLPHIESQTRMDMVAGKYVAQVVDDSGTPRVSMAPGSVDGMTIDELVNSMRDSESYSPAFAGTGATGSGAAGSTSAGSGGAGTRKLTWDEAHNPSAYRAAKEAAESAGSNLQIGEFKEG